MCTNFEQNRPNLISKPAPLSQAEALEMTVGLMFQERQTLFTTKETKANDLPKNRVSVPLMKTEILVENNKRRVPIIPRVGDIPALFLT